ncbi:vacuolar protein sorting-associated protein 16 homolog [Saccostrea cucullata]|uniref:vacuolar protein sorting-associated protein 16 homolog n=1 Tax=Saccostrea cuccullata TaxID=36930 RepID=UPI002ED68236
MNVDQFIVYTVLLRLKESMNQGEFFMSIRSMPIAYALFIQYCRQQNRRLMEDLFYQEDNFQEEGTCKVINSFRQDRLDDRIEELRLAQSCFLKSKNEYARMVGGKFGFTNTRDSVIVADDQKIIVA